MTLFRLKREIISQLPPPEVIYYPRWDVALNFEYTVCSEVLLISEKTDQLVIRWTSLASPRIYHISEIVRVLLFVELRGYSRALVFLSSFLKTRESFIHLDLQTGEDTCRPKVITYR